jgi:hypothetical protein
MEESSSVAVAIGSVLVGCGGVEVGEETVGVVLAPQAANEIARATTRQSNRRTERREFPKNCLVGKVLDQGILSRRLDCFLKSWFICIAGGRSAL